MKRRIASQVMEKFAVATVIVTACAEPATVDQSSQQPVFRIEPANPILTAGGALQFRATSRTGV